MIDDLPTSTERKEEAIQYVEKMFNRTQLRQSRQNSAQFHAYKARTGKTDYSKIFEISVFPVFGRTFLIGLTAGLVIGFLFATIPAALGGHVPDFTPLPNCSIFGGVMAIAIVGMAIYCPIIR